MALQKYNTTVVEGSALLTQTQATMTSVTGVTATGGSNELTGFTEVGGTANKAANSHNMALIRRELAAVKADIASLVSKMQTGGQMSTS